MVCSNNSNGVAGGFGQCYVQEISTEDILVGVIFLVHQGRPASPDAVLCDVEGAKDNPPRHQAKERQERIFFYAPRALLLGL